MVWLFAIYIKLFVDFYLVFTFYYPAPSVYEDFAQFSKLLSSRLKIFFYRALENNFNIDNGKERPEMS